MAAFHFPASGILPTSHFRRGLAFRFRFPICPILLHNFRIQSVSGAFYLFPVLSGITVSGIPPASCFWRGLASRFWFSICPILLHGSSIPPVFRFLPYLSSSIAASHFPASGILPASRFWRSDLSDPAFRCLLSVSGLIRLHGSSILPASHFRRGLASRFRFPICPILLSRAFYLFPVLSGFTVPASRQLPGSCLICHRAWRHPASRLHGLRILPVFRFCLICQPAWRHPTSRLHGLRILPASRLPESCQLPAFGVV